jgi:hypothetical protein
MRSALDETLPGMRAGLPALRRGMPAHGIAGHQGRIGAPAERQRTLGGPE